MNVPIKFEIHSQKQQPFLVCLYPDLEFEFTSLEKEKWKVFMFKMWIWVPHCYMMIVMWQDRYRTVYMIWKGCHGDANIWMIFMVCIVLTKGEQGKVRFSKSPNKIIRWVGDVDCSACGDDFPFPSHHSEIIIRQPIFLSVGRHRTQNMLLNRSQLRLCYISQSVSLFQVGYFFVWVQFRSQVRGLRGEGLGRPKRLFRLQTIEAESQEVYEGIPLSRPGLHKLPEAL